MKKLLMTLMCIAAMTAAGTGLRAQQVTIPIMPGWNWISCPMMDTLDFGTAMGSFTPVEGDVIKTQGGAAFYRNGQWMGTISQFYPGYGYMYKSNRAMPAFVTFHAQQPVPQVVVTTSEPMLITAISAMGGGTVASNDGTYIIVKGICWATHPIPTSNDSYLEEGSGEGSFSATMIDLNLSTTYYYRAYAVTPIGTVYGEQKSFTTRDGIPTLSTTEITSLTCESATSGGDIADNGGLNVIARGICWSTNPNPTLNDSFTIDGTGTGSFTCSITNLNVSTTYYVRAYATTNAGTSYGNEVSFTTPSGIPEVVTNPVTDIYGDGATMGGTIVDDGGAINMWCEIGVCWSTSPNPTRNDNHAYNYDVSNDFTLYRTGLCLSTTYYVRAYAHTRFGTSYGNEVSFTTPAPLWSNGVLPGEFSVSEGQQVRFSQGNLQYRAATDTWRFALNQWSFVGGTQIIREDYGSIITEVNGNVYTESGAKCDNADVSSTYSGWIDLYGWGTSGNNHGAHSYQPWSTNEYVSDYYAYGNSSYNLYDQIGQADWGSNAISNGGAQPNLWRTLTSEEWKYIFNTRSTASGIRYAKAQVCGVCGVILLPDDWDPSYFSLSNTNSSSTSFSSNTITTEQWSILEQHGAVFLCETGRRHRYTYYTPYGDDEEEKQKSEVEVYGFYAGGAYYWSSSYKNTSNAWLLSIKDSGVNPQNYGYRYKGMAIRLVCPTSQSQSPTVTTAEVTNIMHCQATCGGTVVDGGLAIAPHGVCWSTISNPTISDSHTTDGTCTGSFASILTGLMPNTTYYVRAYVTNSNVTVYGNQLSFTTFDEDYFYVDLGLPSGLLWATCNVGANSPEDYGNYFAWGETQPKNTYNWSTYQYSSEEEGLTKYCNTDNLTTLLLEDDAATANWGNDWRMPTNEEFQELYNNTTITWTTQNGVNGRLLTATNGNSLFLPAAGYRNESSLYGADSSGNYWSSSLYSGNPRRAWYFYLGSSTYSMSTTRSRNCGLSVRAVRSSGQN